MGNGVVLITRAHDNTDIFALGNSLLLAGAVILKAQPTKGGETK